MNEKTLGKIGKTILDASKKRKKIIVGIDGYSGIGKTTILEKLTGRNDGIVAVNRDDLLKSRRNFEQLLKKTKDKSKVFELDILEEKKLRRLAQAFRSGKRFFQTKIFNPVSGKIDIEKKYNLAKNILVIEGIFLFHRHQADDIFDVRIFLDGDTKKADARRIKREKKKWGKDYFPETDPDSYFRLTRIAFSRYLREQKPKKRADLVVKV